MAAHCALLSAIETVPTNAQRPAIRLFQPPPLLLVATKPPDYAAHPFLSYAHADLPYECVELLTFFAMSSSQL